MALITTYIESNKTKTFMVPETIHKKIENFHPMHKSYNNRSIHNARYESCHIENSDYAV